jgi:S-adenosyl methyltransferase
MREGSAVEALPERQAPLVDASRPDAPRVYNYLLGGKDNYAADRALAEQLESQAGGHASVRELARVNRSFVLRAVQWSASMLAIGQFLDLGCGLPSVPSVHDAARDGHEGARVVYVDRDPMVISHAAALMAGTGLAAIRADVADPARVLEVVADLQVPGGALIDLAKPAAAIFGGTLSAMPADVARSAVKAYAAALAPGSAVIISCASYADTGLGERMAGLYSAAGEWRNHGYEDVESFFLGADLRILHGRPMDARCWPACPLTPQDQAGARVIGGIGIRE